MEDRVSEMQSMLAVLSAGFTDAIGRIHLQNHPPPSVGRQNGTNTVNHTQPGQDEQVSNADTNPQHQQQSHQGADKDKLDPVAHAKSLLELAETFKQHAQQMTSFTHADILRMVGKQSDGVESISSKTDSQTEQVTTASTLEQLMTSIVEADKQSHISGQRAEETLARTRQLLLQVRQAIDMLLVPLTAGDDGVSHHTGGSAASHGAVGHDTTGTAVSSVAENASTSTLDADSQPNPAKRVKVDDH